MPLKRIRLALARDHDFPNGSLAHGYDFIAPLNDEERLDPDLWRKEKKRCTVQRFWAGEEDENGHLIRTRGGNWAFHYDLSDDVDDDEPGYRFGDHTFGLGDYVSIREHDEVMRTFRVTTVHEIDISSD